MAAGDNHSLALKLDGTVVAWGDNTGGQCSVPTGLNDVVAISAAGNYSLALLKSGLTVGWGEHDGYEALASVPILPFPTAVAISTRYSDYVALTVSGTVVAFGDNGRAQTSVPGDLDSVTAIAAGAFHNIALKSDSTIATWGAASYGATSYPSGLHGVVAITAGRFHSLALGIAPVVPTQTITFPPLAVKTLGDADFDPGASSDAGLPITYTSSDTGVAQIVNGKIHLKKVGATVITAQNFGDAGHQAADPVSRQLWIWSPPTPVVSWGDVYAPLPASLGSVVAISALDNNALGLKANGTVTQWGTPLQPTNLDFETGIVAISASPNHAVAVKHDGTVVAAGDDHSVQCDVPAGLTDVVSVAAGRNFSLALKMDGTVVAWGPSTSKTIQVPAGLDDVVAIAAGSDAYALKSDGRVVTWGVDAVPAGLKNVTSISAGNGWAVAVKTDSSIVSWGWSYSPTTYAPPSGLGGVVSATGSNSHIVALTGRGTVFAWGSNTFGESNVPTGLVGVTAIAAGNQSLALGNVPIPVITFDNLPPKTYGDPEFAPVGSSSSGLPVTFTSSEPAKAEIVNGKINIRKAGTVTFTASQAAKAGYPAAIPVQRTLVVSPKTDTVLAIAATKIAGAADPVLTYSASPLIAGNSWSGRLSRDPGETAGTYPITLGTLSAGPNYSIFFVGAPFTIQATTGIAPKQTRQNVSHALGANIFRSFAQPAIGSGRCTLGMESDPSGNSQTVEVALPGAASVSVAIFDKLGTPVISISADVTESDLWRLARSRDGRHLLPLTWNLRAANGQAVPVGVYLWKIAAQGIDGQKLETIERLGVREAR